MACHDEQAASQHTPAPHSRLNFSWQSGHVCYGTACHWVHTTPDGVCIMQVEEIFGEQGRQGQQALE